MAAAQDSTPKVPITPSAIPAQWILDVREELQLTDVQVGKLQALARTQTGSLSRVTAAYLRAEADLLDASRTDDLAARRLALEKRAKVGIDAEISRLQWEKDSRLLLTGEQRAKVQAIVDRTDSPRQDSRVAIWMPLVSPIPLTRRLDAAARDSAAGRDSNQVRFKVNPSYAEIFVDNTLVGTNFKQIWVTVGSHKVRFAAPGCGVAIEQTIDVAKTGQTLILAPVSILGCLTK